jgi:hypothetical protein
MIEEWRAINMSDIRRHLCWIGLVLLSLIGGCGGSGIERAIVSGSVTFDGKPIEKGFIRFFPIKGTVGPMWGAQITDGAYRADGKGGVPVGTHRVEVEAFRIVRNTKMGADIFEDFGGNGPAVAEVQYIPAQYNIHSEIELVVRPETSDSPVDFELEI